MSSATLYEDVEQALLDRLEANLATINAAWTTANVAWPGAHHNRKGLTGWVRVSVQWADARTVELPLKRRVLGSLVLEFYARHGRGTGELAQWMDGARQVFGPATVVPAGAVTVRLWEAKPGPDRPPEDGWTGQPLRVPFRVYDS